MRNIYLARTEGDSFYFSQKDHGSGSQLRLNSDHFVPIGVISADRIGKSLTEKEAILEALGKEADVVIRMSYPDGGKFGIPNAYACFRCDDSTILERLNRQSTPFNLEDRSNWQIYC